MRLIDAEAWKLELLLLHGTNEKTAWIINRINHAPTVDAVPVIRCKDCVRYKIFGDGYCPWIEQTVEEDFFCADGKRKEP